MTTLTFYYFVVKFFFLFVFLSGKQLFSKEKEDSLSAQIAAHEKYIDETRQNLSHLNSLEMNSRG